MRKLLLFVCVIICTNTFSQKKKSSLPSLDTTKIKVNFASISDEEYKYITIGLIEDLNTGHTTKLYYGFLLQDKPDVTVSGLLENLRFRLMLCYRFKERKPFAAAMVQYTNNKITKILCVPTFAANNYFIETSKKDFTKTFHNANVTPLFLFETLQMMLDYL